MIMASVSLYALGVPAVASAQSTETDASANVADIVVTARRESESLQDVPVSVQVISGDALQKLAITQGNEISKLAPGLTLAGAGTGVTIVLRGITWRPGSGTPATPLYLNEIPFDPQNTLSAIFDIGQVEVLRGPQGTSRGAPSISGAVTITTRKPDLDEFGGYVMGQYGSGEHTNVQGAINVPIIKNVLAIRAGVNLEDSQANRVKSVNSSIDPKYRSRVYRVSALFQPIDTLTVQAMYQRRVQTTTSFSQLVGPGSSGFAAAGIPANFNGPALTLEDRKSAQSGPTIYPDNYDVIAVNANWEVLGHTLSYNYGRQFNRTPLIQLAADTANMIPGFEPYNRQTNLGKPSWQTHEVRISSLPNESRPFDYDIGWFQKKSFGTILFDSPTYLAGSFGALGTPPGAVTTPDNRYVLGSSTKIGIGQSFNSFYGNVRFHLDDKTELTGGLSILNDRVPVNLNIATFAARTIATPLAALGGLPCPGIPGVFVTGLVNSFYPGFCDAVLPAGIGNSIEDHNDKYNAALYNFSLSRKFTDDLLVYATTGTSFRSGLPAINNTGLPSALLVPEPESATSYEVGVKSTFGRRLRINAAVYQINYKNQLTTFGNVPYFNSISGRTSVTSIAFYRNIDARVRGAELEIAASPIDNLSLAANFSYSKIKSKGGSVPCANPTGPAITAANPINFCPSVAGETLNTQAPFQATFNGGYEVPFGAGLSGYFRFNVNYQGKNPNYGNFPVAGKFTTVPAYAIVDLFAGINGKDSAWDVGVYAKNIFDTNKELGRQALLNNIYAPFSGANAGYATVQTTLPREIGVSLRFAFGSR